MEAQSRKKFTSSWQQISPPGEDQESMFKWETLKEVGTQDLQHQGQVYPGKVYEVQLTNGQRINAWVADDRLQYFCHGLTFGGKDAPGAPVSPFTGRPVETILEGYYHPIPDSQARANDILVWKGVPPETTPHSAILTEARLEPGEEYLSETTTRLQTKNGLFPETNVPLRDLIRIYTDNYNAYRRR